MPHHGPQTTAVVIDTIEGVWQDRLSYHYDRFADVLYVTRLDALDEEAYGEEDGNGFHLMRSLTDNCLIGLTVISYWRRFGQGELAQMRAHDLEQTLEASVGDLAQRLAA